MHKAQEQVRQLHREVIGEPYGATSPAEPQIRHPLLRASLIAEEVIETICALIGTERVEALVMEQLDKVVSERTAAGKIEPDLEEAIDGLCDTLVVTYGTAEDIGIDIEPFYDEVHRANMAKKDGPVRPDGKRLKPPGWTPPDITGLLAKLCERMSVYKVGDNVIVRKTCRRGCCDEGEFKAMIDHVVHRDDGTPSGAWVKDAEGFRTYAHFTDEKGVMES